MLALIAAFSPYKLNGETNERAARKSRINSMPNENPAAIDRSICDSRNRGGAGILICAVCVESRFAGPTPEAGSDGIFDFSRLFD